MPHRDGKGLLAKAPEVAHSLQPMKIEHFQHVNTALP